MNLLVAAVLWLAVLGYLPLSLAYACLLLAVVRYRYAKAVYPRTNLLRFPSRS